MTVEQGITDQFRPVQGHESVVSTNVPPELFEFLEDGTPVIHPMGVEIVEQLAQPTRQTEDGADVYEFTFNRSVSDEAGEETIEPSVELTVIVEPNGDRRFRTGGDGRSNLVQLPTVDRDPAIRKMMERLGYQFDGDAIYQPSPYTFQRYCEQEGIAVEILPDVSKIEEAQYNDGYRRGVYIIGALDGFYSHDIQDDHVTALLLGEPELQTAIQEGVRSIDCSCEDIDAFTASYRKAISPLALRMDGHTWLMIMHNVAARIGISEAKIDHLLRIGLQRAEEFDLILTDLPLPPEEPAEAA